MKQTISVGDRVYDAGDMRIGPGARCGVVVAMSASRGQAYIDVEWEGDPPDKTFNLAAEVFLPRPLRQYWLWENWQEWQEEGVVEAAGRDDRGDVNTI